MPYPMTIPQYDVNPLMMPMNFKDGGMASSVQKVQSQGRYGDSMLVHMSPREVGGLQSLARLNGKTMTVNPQTGMPEAFSLESILPAIAGAALTPVLGPAAPFVVGGLYGLTSGSLEKGLLAGLGAYGGANIAGSFANLAEPAVSASTTTVGAPNVMSGVGGSGITASAPQISSAADLANLGGATGTSGTLSTASLSPNASQILGQSGNVLPPQITTSAASIPESIYSTGRAASAPLTTAESLGGVTYTPPKSYAEKVFEGMGKAFDSPSSLMKFAGENKMNIASSLSPNLMPDDPEEVKKRTSQIRPYRYEVENLSGAPISPTGIEDIRYSGRFIEEEPYAAAQGGLMSYAEGGMTGPITATPAEARVYGQIAAVQQAAGIPALDVNDIVLTESGRLSPYTYRPLPSTAEKDYGIYRPSAKDSPSYKELKGEEDEEEEEFKRGGGVGKGSVRKPISRFDPYYKFGTSMSEIAEEQFARGGISDLGPRFLSGGGDGMSDDIPAVIGGKQPARLADGEFVVPADVVSHLGNGSSKAGAKKLHQMMDRIREARTGKKKQAPAVKVEKHMPA